MVENYRLSKDSLLYLLALGAYFYGYFNIAPGVLNLSQSFLIISLAFPLLFGFVLADILGKKIVQWIILGLTIFSLVVIPTLISITNRAENTPFSFIHDNAIQIEEAIK